MAASANYRVHSIDILRGLVMIIMALDHTRDYFHETAMTADPLDPATTSIPLFFTRWITHFCAPTFVFLSGISAYLSGLKKTPAANSSFLIKRGIWLIVVEVLVMTLAITFNPFYNSIILQVIWVIGWSMIVLGGLSRISRKLVLILGIVLVLGHNVLDYLHLPDSGPAAAFWRIFFTAFGTVIPLDKSHILFVLYAILPWTGLMFLGYSIGFLFQRDFPAMQRKRLLQSAGVAVIAAFVFLRWANHYGDPQPRRLYAEGYQNVLSFLNASKYPPSLQFMCMTIGPALVLLSVLEFSNSKLSRFARVYGKVPFFYYVLHFYLLHLLLVLLFFASGYSTSQIADPSIPFYFRPANFGYGLPIVYLIWLLVVLSLYYPCRWFGKYRQNHAQWWLSYL